ncbi:hypothetical protein MSG28_012509 [Choristoneura fumiferana]|uniref:Uncharacterized protein n=1 Tax=Choristoneura fumiferana TaxID=7141 RepID=A0ACC0KDV6_CHOFU|nr:hypothetical protein MSG28_012509 [Choristoneura fumiferana]
MKKMYQVILVCYLFLIVFVSIKCDGGESRVKRYLSFGNISHFFVRLNTKVNMVPWNQIFAQTLGFRVNWDEPPDSFHPYHHLNRRTVFSNFETLLDRNGLSGYHCVRRAVCDMQAIPQPRGVYHKILKMIFRKLDSRVQPESNPEQNCGVAELDSGVGRGSNAEWSCDQFTIRDASRFPHSHLFLRLTSALLSPPRFGAPLPGFV